MGPGAEFMAVAMLGVGAAWKMMARPRRGSLQALSACRSEAARPGPSQNPAGRKGEGPESKKGSGAVVRTIKVDAESAEEPLARVFGREQGMSGQA